jgi:hypothetical protein
MMFVRISLADGSEHEWGMCMEVVPQIGDTLWLYCEIPGEEQTGNDHLEATVVKRVFPVSSYDDPEVMLEVFCPDTVPEGLIADSPEWPSDDPDSYAVQKALKRLHNTP